MIQAKTTKAAKPKYAVLIEWPESATSEHWHEVAPVGTIADCEEVAKEQRRRGAIMASVMKVQAARKLAAQIDGKASPYHQVNQASTSRFQRPT